MPLDVAVYLKIVIDSFSQLKQLLHAEAILQELL
jgi:hypothetical protein